MVLFAANTPEPTAANTPAPSAEPVEAIDSIVQENLLTNIEELKLVSLGSSISLYPEASTESKPVKLENDKTLRGVSELIVFG